MRIRFLGDVSLTQPFSVPESISNDFQSADLVLANLEGLLVSPDRIHMVGSAPHPVIYNSPDAIDLLRAFKVKGVWLANNHMYDLPLPAENTKQQLAAAGISSFGAGATLAEASAPFRLAGNSTSLALFAFGWQVIGCRPATSRGEGVNPLTAEHALHTIRQFRAADNTSCVIFIMHWNYELELYPQPAHRQLAHDLIRAGVDAVIGLHPHVVNGAEVVEGKPVVYSLGNWFFPPRRIGHLVLKDPPIAARELALELSIEGRAVRNVAFHWYTFDGERATLRHECTEGWDGEILRELTPFVGMSHVDYERWFGAHRTRRRGLPIYRDYRHRRLNRLKDDFVRLRHRAIQLLVRLRLRRGRI